MHEVNERFFRAVRDGDIATMRSLTIRGSSVQRYQMRHGAQENCFG